ncbi:MAG TPA: hypothetical protein VND65_09665 [Candidatus Binatia bacterium]|nr:hypothetical protein [Candidatus Binatia bacterium]
MDTRPIVEHLKRVEQMLRRKVEDLKKPVAEAEEDLRNVIGTIAVYERNPHLLERRLLDAAADAVVVGLVDKKPVLSLRGMTHAQAVVAIAKHNGGVLKAQEAKELMIQSGVMRATKNSTHMVHNAIINSGRFDRIGRGEFRLKTPASSNGGGSVTLALPKPANGAGDSGLFTSKSPLQ